MPEARPRECYVPCMGQSEHQLLARQECVPPERCLAGARHIEQLPSPHSSVMFTVRQNGGWALFGVRRERH